MNWRGIFCITGLSLLISPNILLAQRPGGWNTKETEKVFLHIDRPGYMQGDTIWFKAYSWFGYDQIPDTVSKILYVDLVRPDGKTADRKRVLIQDGISQGDFCLQKNFLPGTYTLVAYTQWMRNANTGDPFCQTLTIDPVIEQYSAPSKDSIDLQFFPEGGTLVSGIEGRIAFKAIGTDGLSREVKGSVLDEQGNIVARFESLRKGMGTFMLKPDGGRKYSASVEYNGKKYKFALPSVLSQGSSMSVKISGTKNKPYLTLRYSASEDNSKKYVVGTSGGKVRFAYSLETTRDSSQLWIPVELLPEGICRITVLDAGYKPECERLVYVDKKERFNISVTPDSTSYGTRSKVSLFIKASGPDGTPLQTDLSLAVLDKEQIKNGSNSGICAYKLLESELKGNIEDADFYFKDDSCFRKNALDLLMLTHGYRKFLQDSTNYGEPKYEPERDFVISGKIELLSNKKRDKAFDYREINMNFVSWGGGEHFIYFNTDSLGRFRFHTPLFNGIANAFLGGTTIKKKSFNGDIKIDEKPDELPPFVRPLPSRRDIFQKPAEIPSQSKEVKKPEAPEDYQDYLKTTSLKEIVVKARDKFWYKRFEAKAKKIVNLDSLDPSGNRFESLNDLLIREFGATELLIPRQGLRTIKLPSGGMGDETFFPVYVINGSTFFDATHPVEIILSKLSYLSTMRVNEIKKIMVVPFKSDLVMYYANPALHFDIEQSMVVIETYNKGYRGNPQGGEKIILEGLDAPRTFYSPRYDVQSKENPNDDRRATIFWNPSVRTDANGMAKVDFYTGERKSNLEVIVNGVELGSGHPGQGEALINSALKQKK